MGRISDIETRQQQARLISLLSAGMSRRKACQTVGIGYSTAAAWATDERFSAALAAEIERRQKLIEDSLRAAVDNEIKTDADALADELRLYHRSIVDAQNQRVRVGAELIEKAYSRLTDLPDESLSASDAIRLIQCADNLIDAGLSSWGQALAVDEILRKLGGER